MIRAAIRSFLYDDRAPAVVDLACQPLPADAELQSRNAARIAECRQRLGAKWICAAPINAPDQFVGADEMVEADAADLHPRLPAWMRAHAADEAADLRRALDALDADDRR